MHSTGIGNITYKTADNYLPDLTESILKGHCFIDARDSDLSDLKDETNVLEKTDKEIFLEVVISCLSSYICHIAATVAVAII